MKARYILETLGFIILGVVFRALPLDAASALGGRLMRGVGPLLPAHRVAQRNLQIAFPAMSAIDRDVLLRKAWDNVGRTAGEWPHLPRLVHDEERIQILDPYDLTPGLQAPNQAAIIVSAHFGNWEMAPIASHRAHLMQYNVYPAVENPLLDVLLHRQRVRIAIGSLIKVGRGVRIKESMVHLRDQKKVAITFDHCVRRGIAGKLFGQDVVTPRAPAVLARRFGTPIVMQLVERLKGTQFRIHVIPVPISRTENAAADIAENTRQLNLILEKWVRARPEQWLWMRRRWPDALYDGNGSHA